MIDELDNIATRLIDTAEFCKASGSAYDEEVCREAAALIAAQAARIAEVERERDALRDLIDDAARALGHGYSIMPQSNLHDQFRAALAPADQGGAP